MKSLFYGNFNREGIALSGLQSIRKAYNLQRNYIISILSKTAYCPDKNDCNDQITSIHSKAFLLPVTLKFVQYYSIQKNK